MKKISELQNLTGKIALVTGGAGYLGNAICETLAELGATVVVASRNKDRCISYAEKLSEMFGGNHLGLECDITDRESLDAVRTEIENRFDRLDILVNVASSFN